MDAVLTLFAGNHSVKGTWPYGHPPVDWTTLLTKQMIALSANIGFGGIVLLSIRSCNIFAEHLFRYDH